MQLKDALSDIAEIRAQLDRNHAYRGFRSIAIGISAGLVMIGSLIQLRYGAEMARSPSRYLDIWLFVALGSLSITVAEMILRGRISNDHLVWKMHGRVATSLLPSFIVGALVTAALVFKNGSMTELSRENIWLLPGVWALIYSLGLFSSSNLLHRATRIAAWYYLVAGCLYVVLNWTQHALLAWHMVVIFGVGQLLLAGILFWKLERRDG